VKIIETIEEIHKEKKKK